MAGSIHISGRVNAGDESVSAVVALRHRLDEAGHEGLVPKRFDALVKACWKQETLDGQILLKIVNLDKRAHTHSEPA